LIALAGAKRQPILPQQVLVSHASGVIMARVPNRHLPLIAVLLGLLVLPARAADPAPKQDTNVSGVVAELVECKRQDGQLSIKMRLVNTGDKEASVYAISARNFDAYYVTAANKKYFILRDSEKTPLAVQADGGGYVIASIPKGGAWTWWAKYPAPPADVKKLSYYTPLTPPFDNVPIKD